MTAATNVGLIRTNNEDNFIVCPDLLSSSWYVPAKGDDVIDANECGSIICVADGMGGMNAGEVASAIAVESIKEFFTNSKNLSDVNGEEGALLKRAIVRADEKIKEYAAGNPDSLGMGTTIVMAWIKDSIAHIAWCGDSRAYLFNSKSGLIRLSKDHSYVQQLVDSGELDQDMAMFHPNSNIITRSLGDNSSKSVPDYVSKRLGSGDLILLCSDGLCGICPDDEILEVLISNNSCVEACKEGLIEAALNAGGTDNVTVAIYQCVYVEESNLTSTVSNISRPRFRWWRKNKQ